MLHLFKRPAVKITSVCDSLCRAEAIREKAIFQAALLGPRF